MRIPAFWFVVVLLALLPGLFPGGIVTLSAQPAATPTFSIPLLPTPVASPRGSGELQALAAAAGEADQAGGATTLWAGGKLGVDEPVDLAVMVGDKLPAFGLMTRDGRPFELDLVGEPLLLNFWASWCEPCKVEFPLLVAADRAPGSPFHVVFANVWDEADSYEAFLASHPDDLLVVIDTAGTLPGLYALRYIPVSILVDGSGHVLLVQRGPVNAEVLALAAALVPQEAQPSAVSSRAR